MSSVKIVKVHVILATVRTTCQFSSIQGFTLTCAIAFLEFSIAFSRTVLEFLLKRVGYKVLPTIRVTFFSVGKTLLLTPTSVSHNIEDDAQEDENIQ
jgi:hypothetical protein